MNTSTGTALALVLTLSCALVNSTLATESEMISITEDNFARAETAKNFRNWASRGANEGIAHMRDLPPSLLPQRPDCRAVEEGAAGRDEWAVGALPL